MFGHATDPPTARARGGRRPTPRQRKECLTNRSEYLDRRHQTEYKKTTRETPSTRDVTDCRDPLV